MSRGAARRLVGEKEQDFSGDDSSSYYKRVVLSGTYANSLRLTAPKEPIRGDGRAPGDEYDV